MINIKIQHTDVQKLSPRIAVIGVGGGGGNAVNNMISSNLEGCEFLVCNTDAQALENSLCENKVQLGIHVTGGLGAGSKPDVGAAAAEETLEEVMRYLEGANMAFITAGMGGGTGTGAAPIIAKACREQGILTVGVVTKPFHFEGSHRMKSAENGIEKMQGYVDTLIVIPNQNLFRIANEKTTFAEAFRMADGVLQSGVRGVTDLMVRPGLVNLDFADIRTAMQEMGKAMMGTGEASGEKRAIEAAESAINNPLLDDVSMKGARGVIVNVTGGYDMTLFEADEAANRIRDEVDPDANIIFGATFDEGLEGVMRVSIVATGIDKEVMSGSGSDGVKTIKVGSGSTGTGNIAASSSSTTKTNTETVTASSTPSTPARTNAYVPTTATAPTVASSYTPGVNVSAPAVKEENAPSTSVVEETQNIDMFEQAEFSVQKNEEMSEMPSNTAMRGQRYKDSFIPPAPMQVSSDSVAGQGYALPPTMAHVSPSVSPQQRAGAPAPQQGSGYRLNPPRPPAPQQRKAPQSFFERLSGTVQHGLDTLKESVQSSGNTGHQQHDTRQRVAPTPPSVSEAPSQGSLNIDAPAAKPSKQDDELDIPAFLRRQAN